MARVARCHRSGRHVRLGLHGISPNRSARSWRSATCRSIVAPGEIHAILGPNGAGKTTLLRIMVGLTDPDDGEVLLAGKPIHGARPSGGAPVDGAGPVGRPILLPPPHGSREPGLLRPSPGDEPPACARACPRVSGRCRALRPAGQRATTYSHGMQKRLAIARALLTEPPVLLFDEATHGLDPLAAEQVRTLVTASARVGAAVVWTTQRVENPWLRGPRDAPRRRIECRFQGSVPALMAHGISAPIPRRALGRRR